MSYNHFYKELDARARKLFPGLKELPEISWDHVISPLELKLPKSVYANAEAAIRALYGVSRTPQYQQLLEVHTGMATAPAKNNSVLMAYDFHTHERDEFLRVEINANASGFLMGALMEMTHKNLEPAGYAPLASLRSSF